MRLPTSDSKLFLFNEKKKRKKKNTSCLLVWTERLADKTKGGGRGRGRTVSVQPCVCMHGGMDLCICVYRPVFSISEGVLCVHPPPLHTWCFCIKPCGGVSMCISHMCIRWYDSISVGVWGGGGMSLQPLEYVQLNKLIVL